MIKYLKEEIINFKKIITENSNFLIVAHFLKKA